MINKLTALINNFNTDCYKQYTNVSSYLGDQLAKSLKEIIRFYYSDFWETKFQNRLYEENISYNPIQLDRIQGMISEIGELTKFKLFDTKSSYNGVSNYGDMIALNVNLSLDKMNDSHINNVIMHEFGHRQYNQKEFELVIKLNKIIIDDPSKHIKDSLSENDYKYFTDDNELRQRIIPIIKEMYDNNWTVEETYETSNNLAIDDIKDIFTKEYIITLINKLL